MIVRQSNHPVKDYFFDGDPFSEDGRDGANRRMTQTGEKFDRINAIPAYQLVADAIEREILARRIRPGEPIGTEAQLVKQFGVNRSTVREGIRLLEQSGLIHRDSGRRLTASLPHYSRLATRMSRAMLLHEVTFRELWEATTALEIATVEQAAEHATADVIAELQANVASTEQASADPAAVAELDTQFHSLIAKASQNRVLQLAREPSSLLIFPTTEIILRKLKEGVPRLIQAHRKIADAISQHDKETSRLWMLRHAKDWRRGFERAGKDIDQPIDRVYMKEVMTR
jgi:GntR family transcriptional regulator, transcriptional repressor for pyruvate dehydrogenase complex